MDSQNNFVFSFNRFIQFKATDSGYEYFPEVIRVLFDEAYYLNQNPDVLAAVQSGALSSGFQHFSANGLLERRAPSLFFDEDLYLLANPDVKAAVDSGALSSGLQHFFQSGFNEGRDALAITLKFGDIKLSAFFDESFYLQQYSDIESVVANKDFSFGFEHFLRFGIFEGRNPSHFYNENLYLNNNPDVKAAVDAGDFASGLIHYLQFGHVENRLASLLFNPTTYGNNNPDVVNAVANGVFSSLLDHYLEFGSQEGRLSTEFYEEAYYLNQNPDIKNAVANGDFSTGYAHFLQHGIKEGRAPSAFYNEDKYLSANPDVQKALTDGIINSGLEHYLKFGFLEGRKLAPENPPPSNSNQAPIATNDSANTVKNGSVTISVLANDSDPDGDAISLSNIGTPNNGTATSGPNGTIVYTPKTGYVGGDIFTYTISDGQKTSTASVTVSVKDNVELNQAPVASNDTASTTANNAVNISVLANDSDPDGDAISLSNIGTPSNGATAIGANSTITYTPDAGFVGTDTFSYVITDGQKPSTANVTVTVTASNGEENVSYANSNQGVLVDLSKSSASKLNFGPNFKLMPVGDSITEGWDASITVENDPSYQDNHEGYRSLLQQDFQALGLPVDFVGSLQHGPDSMADKDHEGHAGKGFGFFLKDVSGFSSRMRFFMDQADPDVILLMLGTNDGGPKGAKTPEEDAEIAQAMLDGMSDLLDSILGDSTFTGQVLVGTIAPAHPDGEWKNRNSRFELFNDGLDELVAGKNSNQLKFVEVGSKLDSRQDMADPSVDNGLHPDESGYIEMADAWYGALEEVIFSQTETLSGNAKNVIGSASDDVLIGDGQANVLEGGAGDDLLTGKGGPDRFVYRSLADGFDRITDFTSSDVIEVVDSGFTGNLSAGFNLVTNGSATNNQPTFLYNSSNGILSYDSDGNGGQSAVDLLQLDGAPGLIKSQIVIA